MAPVEQISHPLWACVARMSPATWSNENLHHLAEYLGLMALKFGYESTFEDVQRGLFQEFSRLES